MPSYISSDRPLTIRTPPQAQGLLLVGIQGHEAISQLFQFRLDLIAANNTTVSFESLLGQEATVTLRLEDGALRRFSGIVSRLTQGGRDADFTSFQADLVPRLWLRTKRVQSRVFQQMSVPDILKHVLDGLDVVYLLSGKYEARDYCTQYQESDFAFVSRLMEEDGIHYYFRHGEDSHQLVISDSTAYPRLAAGDKVVFDATPGGTQPGVRIREWFKTQEVCAGQFTLWDYHFEIADSHLERRASVPDRVMVGTVEHPLHGVANRHLEKFEFPGGYAQRFDGVGPGGADRGRDLQKVYPEGERLAGLRAEEEAARSLTTSGAGNAGQLLPGHAFSLQKHFNADGDYLITRVEHRATMSGYRTGQDSSWEYANRFECLPAAMPYRPGRQTPRPIIAGAQTATVTGTSDQPSFLDKYGRVKVQFHWDRHGKHDSDSSCWVRVAQIWAGKNWGAFFWPRIGHEVVVIFEEGNPDCPLIVGSVYNSTNVPPVDLPADAAIAGIKSCVFGHDASHFSSLIFYDAPGAEFVVTHSHLTEMNNNNADTYTRNPGTTMRFHGSFLGL